MRWMNWGSGDGLLQRTHELVDRRLGRALRRVHAVPHVDLETGQARLGGGGNSFSDSTRLREVTA